MAKVAAASARAAEAWVDFCAAIEQHCDESVDQMTPETRGFYLALIATGTPRLDAICDAQELADESTRP